MARTASDRQVKIQQQLQQERVRHQQQALALERQYAAALAADRASELQQVSGSRQKVLEKRHKLQLLQERERSMARERELQQLQEVLEEEVCMCARACVRV